MFSKRFLFAEQDDWIDVVSNKEILQHTGQCRFKFFDTVSEIGLLWLRLRPVIWKLFNSGLL